MAERTETFIGYGEPYPQVSWNNETFTLTVKLSPAFIVGESPNVKLVTDNGKTVHERNIDRLCEILRDAASKGEI